MNDTHIQEILTDVFLTLNEFSGIPYIKRDAQGKILNVYMPNVPFTEPQDKRFFSLYFMPNEPDTAGLGTEAENFWTGIFQIDVIVPIGAGLDEVNAKYDWITKLFQRGKSFSDVMIIRTYRASHGPEAAFYRTVIRIEFQASLPK
jgi:hypothetical protein